MLTVGHGTLPAEDFTALLEAEAVSELVDIRSYPGSRTNPQYWSKEMARWLPESGIGYLWMRELGGRRKAVPGSKHVALRNPSFRAYADYMETELFVGGVDALLAHGDGRVVMCSESVWWRCHRRLLADYLTLVRRISVGHVMHHGRVSPHVLTDGVRVEGESLVYDVFIEE